VEIHKQFFLDEAEEIESEPIERTMKDMNLTEGILMTEADIRLSADTDSNEQRAAATG